MEQKNQLNRFAAAYIHKSKEKHIVSDVPREAETDQGIPEREKHTAQAALPEKEVKLSAEQKLPYHLDTLVWSQHPNTSPLPYSDLEVTVSGRTAFPTTNGHIFVYLNELRNVCKNI
jgi:hypothetical protein